MNWTSSLCLSLGQWKSLIRPWPANEERWVDSRAEGRQRGRQFLEMITDSFPCLSCLWKEKETSPPPLSSIPTSPTLIVSQPLNNHHRRRRHSHWTIVNHCYAVLFHFFFSLADLFHSFNKQFPSFYCPFSQLLFLFLVLCSIVESRVPLVNNFSVTSSWVPSLFISGLWPAWALVSFK